MQEALRGVDAAVDELVATSRRDRRIRLGYLIGTGADVLFRLVRHFEAAYPEISVEPREFDFSDPTAGLADGTTEVAIIRPPVDLPEHRMLILDAEDWVACLPRDHRLAHRPELSHRRTARRSDRGRAEHRGPVARLLDGDGCARRTATDDRGRRGHLRGGDHD